MNNPPAFPNDVKQITERAGMTLRDYFAARALQGLIASPHCPYEFDASTKARDAYMIADEMLKARQ